MGILGGYFGTSPKFLAVRRFSFPGFWAEWSHYTGTLYLSDDKNNFVSIGWGAFPTTPSRSFLENPKRLTPVGKANTPLIGGGKRLVSGPATIPPGPSISRLRGRWRPERELNTSPLGKPQRALLPQREGRKSEAGDWLVVRQRNVKECECYGKELTWEIRP